MSTHSCYNCEKRHRGCHSECESYAEQQADNKRKREYLRRDQTTDAFFKMSYLKRKKRIHYKNGK